MGVVEYALVEQSTDNPTHVEFQERVPAAISARRGGWTSPSPENALETPNQALNPLGYSLTLNPGPPFGAFALYQDGQLVQDGILHFWPVTLQPDGSDFSLRFETLDGRLLVASRTGLSPWSSGEQPQSRSSPVLSSAAGMVVLQAGRLALDRPRPDNQDAGYDDAGFDTVFGQQNLAGRAFYFYTQDGLTGLHYNGSPMGFSYDQVVHDASGPAAIFNPGGNDHIVWFYALRDGLWYYVEVSERY